MQKHVNLVDLVKSFPTNIYLQNLPSIQTRTSPVKFAHLAEKSEKSSISNLSTKPDTAPLEMISMAFLIASSSSARSFWRSSKSELFCSQPATVSSRYLGWNYEFALKDVKLRIQSVRRFYSTRR